MTLDKQVFHAVTAAKAGITLAELLAQHPALTRRTAQRWVGLWIAQGRRKPVGYQQDFLQSYQPGVTWYLPLTLRRQLHKMGQTVQASEPAGPGRKLAAQSGG